MSSLAVKHREKVIFNTNTFSNIFSVDTLKIRLKTIYFSNSSNYSENDLSTLLKKMTVIIFSRRRDIIICTMCVHLCVRVHAWVTQFSLKLLQLHIFGKLLVQMNFYTLQYFLGGLVNFGLLFSQ